MKRLCNKYLDDLIIDKSYVTKVIADAKAGEKDALIAYSVIQLVGFCVEKNKQQALNRLNAFMSSGDAYGRFIGGVLKSDPVFEYGVDILVAEDYLRSVAFGGKAGGVDDDKTAVAARILGEFYSGAFEEIQMDEMESFRAHKLSAELGCVESMVEVGRMLINGVSGLFDITIEKDEPSGVKLLLDASGRGDDDATKELVKYYLRKAAGFGDSVKEVNGEIREILNIVSSIKWML